MIIPGEKQENMSKIFDSKLLKNIVASVVVLLVATIAGSLLYLILFLHDQPGIDLRQDSAIKANTEKIDTKVDTAYINMKFAGVHRHIEAIKPKIKKKSYKRDTSLTADR